jgi:hypothetical protein
MKDSERVGKAKECGAIQGMAIERNHEMARYAVKLNETQVTKRRTTYEESSAKE